MYEYMSPLGQRFVSMIPYSPDKDTLSPHPQKVTEALRAFSPMSDIRVFTGQGDSRWRNVRTPKENIEPQNKAGYYL